MKQYKRDGKKADFIDIYKWYSRTDVRFELAKQLYKREAGLIVPKHINKGDASRSSVRMLKIHNVNHFSVNLKAVRMAERQVPYNFYYSLGTYSDGIPNQHLNFKTRDNSLWNLEYHKHMSGFDFLLDIDVDGIENLEYAYFSAMEVFSLFNQLKVPFSLRFSGGGFHFIIPSGYFPRKSFNPKDENNIYKLHAKIAKYIYERYTELVDLSIYDSRRIVKLPYSLAVYEDDCFVCHPFDSENDFYKFDPNMMTWDKYDYKIERRGVHIFNENGNIAELLECIGL